MATTRIIGYTLNLKYGGKLIKGLETTGLKLKANFEEILLKADQGVPNQELVDYDTDMSFSGKTYERDQVAEASTHEDFETLREAATIGAEVAFVYGIFTTGKKIVSGTGIITDYSEDGTTKDTGTFSGTITAKKGTVTFTTF
jgi:hypothetical protein